MADVEFPPEVVFLLFIPPLVFVGAYLTPWRDFKSNLRPILLLAIGLVIATIFAVAVVTMAVVNEPMPWSVAFVLATIVAPPDAVAVLAVTRRLKVPRRIVNVLEGESLANDTVALVAYKMAIAAAVSGTFSLATAGRQLAWASIGGLLVGWLVGALTLWMRRQMSDPPVQVTLSLLTPFAAYLSAEAVEASGVLAVVTAGVYIARYSSRFFSAEVRTLGMSFWRVVEFLLNGLAFILIGLQLRKVYFQLGDYPTSELLKDMGAIVVTISRHPSAVGLPVRLPATLFHSVAAPTQFISSLATGSPDRLGRYSWGRFARYRPGRAARGQRRHTVPLPQFGDLSLVRGHSLNPDITRPEPAVTDPLAELRDDGLNENEEMKGRWAVAEAGLRRLDELASEPWALPVCVERIRAMYTVRIQRFQARLHHDGNQHYEENAASMRRLQLELLNEERRASHRSARSGGHQRRRSARH